MKRILFALLALIICFALANCSLTSAPLEVTKASSADTIGFSLSPGKKSVLLAPDGHRFVMVETVKKSDSEVKFKVKDIELIDSAGKSHFPVGVAPFGEMSAFKDFGSIVSGNVKIESPEGGAVTVGKLEPDAQTGFSISGKNVKATLVFEVPSGGSDFQLKILNAGPVKVTAQPQ